MSYYVEINEPFNTEYPTWIIAFCPDTDSFFVTNQRYFYWEHKVEFGNEKDAINYFEDNISYFLDVDREIMSGMFYHDINVVDNIFLENTNKWYAKSKG